MESDLFEGKLDIYNKAQFDTIYKWTRLMLIFVIITGLFDIYSSFKLVKIYSNLSGYAPRIFKVQFIANIAFLALYGILLPLQAYFFYHFVLTSKKAVQWKNEMGPNYSLQWLLRQTVVATILFGVNAIWAIVNILFMSGVSGNEGKVPL
jgi:hypothetical protein